MQAGHYRMHVTIRLPFPNSGQVEEVAPACGPWALSPACRITGMWTVAQRHSAAAQPWHSPGLLDTQGSLLFPLWAAEAGN